MEIYQNKLQFMESYIKKKMKMIETKINWNKYYYDIENMKFILKYINKIYYNLKKIEKYINIINHEECHEEFNDDEQAIRNQDIILVDERTIASYDIIDDGRIYTFQFVVITPKINNEQFFKDFPSLEKISFIILTT